KGGVMTCTTAGGTSRKSEPAMPILTVAWAFGSCALIAAASSAGSSAAAANLTLVCPFMGVSFALVLAGEPHNTTRRNFLGTDLRIRNPKSEIRNSKSETNPNYQRSNDRNQKPSGLEFASLAIGICFGFRVS